MREWRREGRRKKQSGSLHAGARQSVWYNRDKIMAWARKKREDLVYEKDGMGWMDVLS